MSEQNKKSILLKKRCEADKKEKKRYRAWKEAEDKCAAREQAWDDAKEKWGKKNENFGDVVKLHDAVIKAIEDLREAREEWEKSCEAALVAWNAWEAEVSKKEKINE